jgi:hypothetical protein
LLIVGGDFVWEKVFPVRLKFEGFTFDEALDYKFFERFSKGKIRVWDAVEIA